jgi:hypothetical protein
LLREFSRGRLGSISAKCYAYDDEFGPVFDDADYDKQCALIREENIRLLADFADWLAAAGLSATTIRGHRYNLDFYLNHFLIRSDMLRASEGVDCVGEFLGDWFIYKAVWSSRNSIKGNAASLKKFYAFMAERGLIKPGELDALRKQIKEELPDWLETLERYNTPDDDPPDGWPFTRDSPQAHAAEPKALPSDRSC